MEGIPMTWLDDSVRKARDFADQEAKKELEADQFFAPIVTKLLNELGDSLFAKHGVFGLKRHYEIATSTIRTKTGKGAWTLKTNPDKISHNLTVEFYICADENGTYSLEGHAGSYNSYGQKRLCGQTEDAEKKVKEFLKEVVFKFIKEHGDDPFKKGFFA